MKTMLKLALMIALLGSTVMADGDMGNGNQCPPTGCVPPPCTVNCGFAAQSDETESTVGSTVIEPTGGSLESIAIDFVEQSYLLFTF